MWSSAYELRRRIDRGEVSCEEATRGALERIATLAYEQGLELSVEFDADSFSIRELAPTRRAALG